MATSSKKDDEFFALAMACRIILKEWNRAKSDHPFYPGLSEKSFIGQMGKKYFASFTKKAALSCGDKKMARFKRLLKTRPDASCNPRATGRSGCTPAEPYPPSARSRWTTINQNTKYSRCLFHLRQRIADQLNPRCLFYLRQQVCTPTKQPSRPKAGRRPLVLAGQFPD